MGISGHILGPRKLRRLRAWSGIDFDRAWNRNGYGEARLINEHGKCSHFRVDFQEHRIEEIDLPIHWLSCPPRSALDTARAELAFRRKQVP